MFRAISFGGGVQSTAMLILAAQGVIPHQTAIFADVGADSENPYTLAYMRDYTIPYADAHGIELVTIRKHDKHGAPVTLYGKLMSSERSIDIPMRMSNGAPGNRNCTETFKIRPIANELKRRGATKDEPGFLAMGISLDEYPRMRSNSGFAHYGLEYPLIDLRMDRAACLALVDRAGLPVPPKSSCWFCPYKRRGEWERFRKAEPALFAQAVQLERSMIERRAKLLDKNGNPKDAVYLTSFGKPLDEAITDNGQLDMFEVGTCDIGGYCHA